MKEVVKSNHMRVDNCTRCGDEKQVNKFGLCKSCESEVDYEYSALYKPRTMEY